MRIHTMQRSIPRLSPWLVLVCAASGTWAAKRAFSINDDLLAFPQYEVIFPREYILDDQAEELLQWQDEYDLSGGNPSTQNPQVYLGKDAANPERTDERDRPMYTYEEMILDDRRLLCQIPHVKQDDPNATAAAQGDTKAEEQKELARATDRGLELLREMEGRCLYYFSGWWSYSFCYRKQIKQFHALPAGRGTPPYPPVEDTNALSFILGRFPSDDAEMDGETEHKPAKPDVAELHTKGGSRYLVQHLRGGTKCDLTGRDRRVEVQFHCHPQGTDQIGWIKELTTCSYLMQDEVHNIECREILMPDEVEEWAAAKGWYTAQGLAAAAAEAAADLSGIQTVGGIEVGGQKLVGMAGKEIEKGRVASAGEERVELIGKRQDGEEWWLSKQDLKKYDLDQDGLENMKQRVEQIAKGRDWTLEAVEVNGDIQYRVFVDKKEDQDSQGEEDGDKPAQKPAQDEPRTPETNSERPQPLDQGQTEDQEEGSKEIFKDEL
ncbi:hypothetical protein N7510_002380 [Penicillium lagena]|uniref:uncharacterized protein n=1 Tax=Penicillium lagena TaxID=94218 RepID=UPI002540D417|nr:uncharacterized protein N7510_002380 [Penicillium lagena]KAJ5626071.1 hypothetical protein N7510_002380 [Penicillium lagena]